MVINTGTTDIHLKAKTIPEKIKWFNALKNSRESAIENSWDLNFDKLIKNDKKIIGNYQNYFESFNCKKIDDKLAEVWNNQALLQETISSIMPIIDKSSRVFDLLERID